MEITSHWLGGTSREDYDAGDERTVHFRPPRRRYTPPSALMTLSRFAAMIDLSFLLLIFFTKKIPVFVAGIFINLRIS